MTVPADPRFQWEYLRQASEPSLQSFELSRLNHAANLRKEISALLDQWLEETACALVARWLREHRLLRPSPLAGESRRDTSGDPFGEPAALRPAPRQARAGD